MHIKYGESYKKACGSQNFLKINKFILIDRLKKLTNFIIVNPFIGLFPAPKYNFVMVFKYSWNIEILRKTDLISTENGCFTLSMEISLIAIHVLKI